MKVQLSERKSVFSYIAQYSLIRLTFCIYLTAAKKDESEDDDSDVDTEPNASKDEKETVVKATRPQGRSIWLFFCCSCIFTSPVSNFKTDRSVF